MYDKILELNSKDLLSFLQDNYNMDIPEQLNTAEELSNAGILIGKIMSAYSYIMSIYLVAKLNVREAKKLKFTKDEIDDLIDKRDILKEYSEILKLKYTAISRMITVKKQVDDELKMMNLT